MVASTTRPVTVSRTSSSSSIDFSANAFNAAEQRRTRKRISAAQLAYLEDLYRQSSHPSRDERDALAKRIQMETKSVTIWFQNKRQTDRKVALHNATNSRNVAAPVVTSIQAPNIILTTPSSPTYLSGVSVPKKTGNTSSSDGLARRQPTTRPYTFKRVSSQASSVASSSSTTSTSRTRPSLDRIASRSEIRFTDSPPLRGGNSATTIRMTTNGGSRSMTVTRISNSAPLSRTNSLSLERSNSTMSLTPDSPPPPKTHPLWATMLSSPPGASSPPPADYVAYTRARKVRTLDWACATARVIEGESSPKLGLSIAKFEHATAFPPSSLGSVFPLSQQRESAAREKDYEEAITMSDDDAELATPQDISMSWDDDEGKINTMSTHIMRLAGSFEMRRSGQADTMIVDEGEWEEDEMHAALALCGLRG